MPIYLQYYFWLAATSLVALLLERIRPWRKEQKVLRQGIWQDLFWLVFNGHYLGLLMAMATGRLVILFNDGLKGLGIPAPDSLALMSGAPSRKGMKPPATNSLWPIPLPKFHFPDTL